MSFYKKSCLMVTAILLGFSLAACEKKGGEGTAERAGKQVDKAVEETGKAIGQATETVKEAAKATADKVEEVAKDASKAVTATKDK